MHQSSHNKELSFPASQECGPGDTLHSQRESSHPRTAVVRFAQILNVEVRILHVFLQIRVHLLLFPRKSLYVLHTGINCKQTQLNLSHWYMQDTRTPQNWIMTIRNLSRTWTLLAKAILLLLPWVGHTSKWYNHDLAELYLCYWSLKWNADVCCKLPPLYIVKLHERTHWVMKIWCDESWLLSRYPKWPLQITVLSDIPMKSHS